MQGFTGVNSKEWIAEIYFLNLHRNKNTENIEVRMEAKAFILHFGVSYLGK